MHIYNERFKRRCVEINVASAQDKQAQLKGQFQETTTNMLLFCTGTWSIHTNVQRRRAHTHTLILFTHSCHEQTDRFLTRVFNSNHINPPLGTVGMSTRQALSRPLCCLGSLFVCRGNLRNSRREMGINEWQGSQSNTLLLLLHFVKIPDSEHQIKKPSEGNRFSDQIPVSKYNQTFTWQIQTLLLHGVYLHTSTDPHPVLSSHLVFSPLFSKEKQLSGIHWKEDDLRGPCQCAGCWQTP